MHDDLAVAVRAEGVARGLELGAQLAVVVNLAVVDEPDRLVLVGDRLMATGAVDDRQAPVAQAHVVPLKTAGVVRAAVHEHRGHAAEKRMVGWPGEAEDAAHGPVSPRGIGLHGRAERTIGTTPGTPGRKPYHAPPEADAIATTSAERR